MTLIFDQIKESTIYVKFKPRFQLKNKKKSSFSFKMNKNKE